MKSIYTCVAVRCGVWECERVVWESGSVCMCVGKNWCDYTSSITSSDHFSCFTGAYAQNQHQRVTSAVTRLVEWWTLWGEESLVLLLD